MCPAVPMICWVTASLPCHVVACCHNCSCLLCWSFWIATSDGSLLPYLKFACSIEPCGLLLWSPILPIQRPSLPALYGKWFMVDIGSGKFLHRRSFSVTVLVGVCLQGQVPHIGLPWNWYFWGAPTKLWWHQFQGSSIGDEFNTVYINYYILLVLFPT